MPSEIPTPTPSEIPVETLTPIPSETPSESPFQEQSETSIEKKEEKEEEKSETPAPQASEQSAVTEPQQEGSITGSIVSENEQIVAGKASKGNDFEYNFGEGERAEIISGSVKVKDNAIGDGNIKLKVNKEKAEVSTEYSIVEKGFGEEYLGKKGLSLEIDLSKFEINITESGRLDVELAYGEVVLVKAEEEIDLEGRSNEVEINESEAIINETEINITEMNVTEINITEINITEVNVTGLNVSASNLSFVKDIENIRIQKGQNITIDLSEHFVNAEKYESNISNITILFEGEIMILMPDEEFIGVQKGMVIAFARGYSRQPFNSEEIESYIENESIESNEFSILVSSGNVRIDTAREKIVVGQKVKWTRNVSLETAENVTIELEKGAENVSVTKIENGVESEAIATISGNVIAETEFGKEPKLAKFAKGLFKTFTGRAVDGENISEIINVSRIVEVTLNDSATEYKIEYYTEAPRAFEEETSNGKRVIVSAPDELNYTDVLSFANISERYKVGEESNIKIYWREGKSYVAFDAYDMNGNGALDYVEWIVPHLSNQTFEIILITKAEHLDSNRTFVEDVYEEVKLRDNIWKEIPEGDYLRVTFEQNLTSEKDITIYARSSSGAGIDIYEKDKGEIIASFDNVGEDKEYKVYLSNLIGEQNTFDLLVKGGSAEFDYVVDPPIGNCGILNTENEIYTLTNNVSSTEICFNVTAEHITIDCQGYEINYSYGAISGYGVYSNANFTAVKNCIVKEGTNATNNKHAIYFYEANNGTIDNNTITTSGAGSYGIYLNVNASFNNISSNNVITSGSTANGIVLTSSSANTLPSNTITINNASAYGILINNSDNIFLINNFIRSNGSDVWLHGLSGGMGVSNVSIIGNNLLGNYRGAIYLDGVVSSTNIFNNTIFTYGINVPGIYASFGSFNQTNIESNLIHTERASSDAVSIFNGRGVNITNNNVTTNGSASNGFRLRAGSDLKINDNKIITFNSTSISIYLMQGTNSSIINNNSITTFGASTYGIVLSAGKNNTFNNNLIKTYGFSGHGIAIFGSLNNTLNNNSILTHNNSAMGLLFASFSDSIIMSGMDIRTNSSVFAYPIYIDGAHNFTITDSVLNASFGLQELFVSAAANGGEWNFTNVTRGDGVSSFRRMWETGANGILNAHWYVNAYANYTNVSIAPNANISAWNVDDLRRFSEFTNESDGRIARQTLLEYKQSSDISLTYYSNYTFNATSLLIGGEELSQSWNISTNRNLGFMFKEEIILPNINFTEPTPPNGSVISRSYALINVSIVEQNLKEAIFNWNGTNYSIYDDSLLLMYNFENLSSLGENDSFVRDVSRYGNNGIVYGSMKWIPNGRFGGAFKMNGTASAEEYIQIADSTLFRVASKTISFWLNKSDESFSKIFNLASQNYGFGLDGFETEVTWLDASEAPAFCGQSLFIPLGVWSYYSLVFNVTGSQVNTTLYIDGRAVSSCQNNLGYSSNYGSSFIIGKYGSMTFFNGSIDEFRFWNRALTLEEINQLYFTSLHKQNNTNWELFVNKLQRRGKNIVLTGSNSNLLSQELASHLTGRYAQFEVLPFSFKEFLQAKGKVNLNPLVSEEKGVMLNLLSLYIKCGGFPEVVTTNLDPAPYLQTLFDYSY